MPCAIVVGCAPAVLFTGPQKLPVDVDEMAVAGGLMGKPVNTVRCKTVDLVVPADSEIVIEGLIDSDLLEPEGPFGRVTDVALEDFNMSMRVTASRKRKSLLSIISGDSEQSRRFSKSGLRANVSGAFAAHASVCAASNVWSCAQAADELTQSYLSSVRAGHTANGSVARHARRCNLAGTMREACDCCL